VKLKIGGSSTSGQQASTGGGRPALSNATGRIIPWFQTESSQSPHQAVKNGEGSSTPFGKVSFGLKNAPKQQSTVSGGSRPPSTIVQQSPSTAAPSATADLLDIRTLVMLSKPNDTKHKRSEPETEDPFIEVRAMNKKIRLSAVTDEVTEVMSDAEYRAYDALMQQQMAIL